jgi:phospholipid/cholesterol/gamma-HCH transport system permease protein
VPAVLGFSRPSVEALEIRFGGPWTFQHVLPEMGEVEQQLAAPPQVTSVAFETSELTQWDSGLLTFLIQVMETCAQQQISVDRTGLPPGVRRLLALAETVPEREETRRSPVRPSWLTRIGAQTQDLLDAAIEIIAFVGEAVLSACRLLRGRAHFRRSDLALILQDCGAQALPIVSLISFLVGLILAFMGAVQLQQFGAQTFVANLVGLGMSREMGAMMVGIIMAGRTGAAFAAQLGTMRVNEEIDALTTMGISPMDFLVLPRMLALVVMLPLLCLYADLLGILGGLVVGVGMLDLGLVQYVVQTREALAPMDFVLGLIKSAVYGALVAIAGCLRGMQCGNSSAAVGTAATSAVVTSIVWIVVASAILTLIYDALGV